MSIDTTVKEEKRIVPLHTKIVIGMLLGVLTGLLFGKSVLWMGEFGKLVIQLIKVVAAPLLFFAIVSAILRAEMKLKDGLKMSIIATINATIALLIGLTLSNVIQPGKYLQLSELQNSVSASAAPSAKKIDFVTALAGHIPDSFVKPFVDNAIISIVIIALLVGFGIRKVKKLQISRGEKGYLYLEDSVETFFQVLETILQWVIKLSPFAVYGVVAKSVGEFGFAPFKGLGMYVLLALGGMTIHILIVYQSWIRFYCNISLVKFWKTVKNTLVYSIGANSSLATLPLTLKSLDQLGVSKTSSALGACVGTNLNNDGIILYEAMAVLFVAQANGMDLSLSQQFFAAISCMIAAMGIAGVPEAGFISLSIVLATVGLPMEMLPLLLTVDWIVARARTVTNVLSDMTVSIVIDKK